MMIKASNFNEMEHHIGVQGNEKHGASPGARIVSLVDSLDAPEWASSAMQGNPSCTRSPKGSVLVR